MPLTGQGVCPQNYTFLVITTALCRQIRPLLTQAWKCEWNASARARARKYNPHPHPGLWECPSLSQMKIRSFLQRSPASRAFSHTLDPRQNLDLSRQDHHMLPGQSRLRPVGHWKSISFSLKSAPLCTMNYIYGYPVSRRPWASCFNLSGSPSPHPESKRIGVAQSAPFQAPRVPWK